MSLQSSLKPALLTAAFALVGLVPAVADAGAQYTMASCSKNADFSGSCSGNFLGFRNNSDYDARAYFYVNSNGTMGFSARLNGISYSCSVNSAYPAMVDIFPQLMTARGYFYLTWDSAGNCTYTMFYNGSQYANY